MIPTDNVTFIAKTKRCYACEGAHDSIPARLVGDVEGAATYGGWNYDFVYRCPRRNMDVSVKIFIPDTFKWDENFKWYAGQQNGGTEIMADNKLGRTGPKFLLSRQTDADRILIAKAIDYCERKFAAEHYTGGDVRMVVPDGMDAWLLQKLREHYCSGNDAWGGIKQEVSDERQFRSVEYLVFSPPRINLNQHD